METVTTQATTYAPFTYEEFQVIKAEREAVGNYLPTDPGAQRKLWENCTRIRGKAENQPCGTCGKTGGLWMKCIDDIKAFIRDRA